MIGIYKITNKVTNKIYIGQSGRLQNRWSGHKKNITNEHSKQYNDELYQDMRKYGLKNFSFEILETISLDELEEKWIKEELEKNTKMYNKSLYPSSDKYHCIRKFNQNEAIQIIELLKENKISNIKIAKMFNCSPAVIDNINNGISYVQDDIDYPIRVYSSKGEKNHNAKYSDKEVLMIRKAFKDKTIKDLFEIYSNSDSYKSFERMVTGRSYKHIPIYKKRENEWYKDDMTYRLEP